MKKPRISFSAGAECAHPSQVRWAAYLVSFSMVFLENAKQPVLAGLGVALHFLRLLHRFIQYRH